MADEQCCEGGPLKPSCQLCAKSPTYFRLCPKCKRPRDIDPTTNQILPHPECAE